MKRKSLKRLAAFTLAASMVFGSAMTVLATETTPAGEAEGTGSYEGGEMKYPTLSVTLPTIPTGTYDYIADPNGLIAATENARYSGFTFDENAKGIFFLTDKDAKSYTGKSAAQTVTNENAQDIDVTVKLEQKTAGDAIIKYAESAAFETTDKDNKLYLAITDDAATNPNTAALSAAGAATVKATVAGVPGNYKPGYDATDGYTYTKKDEADLTDWNECSFILTGAINTNATWGDDVTFPTIKVTWSYAEHKDGPVATPGALSATNKAVVISGLEDGAVLSKVELVKSDGSAVTMTSGTHYTFTASTGTFTIVKDALVDTAYVGGKYVLTFGDTQVEIPVVAAQ